MSRRQNTAIAKHPVKGTGQLAQAELGLDYYIARWYDPLTGHFTQADTIFPEPGKSQSFDRYAYVMNNPLRYNDPSGHICKQYVGSTCVAYSNDSYSPDIKNFVDIKGLKIEAPKKSNKDSTYMKYLPGPNLGRKAEENYDEPTLPSIGRGNVPANRIVLILNFLMIGEEFLEILEASYPELLNNYQPDIDSTLFYECANYEGPTPLIPDDVHLISVVLDNHSDYSVEFNMRVGVSFYGSSPKFEPNNINGTIDSNDSKVINLDIGVVNEIKESSNDISLRVDTQYSGNQVLGIYQGSTSNEIFPWRNECR